MNSFQIAQLNIIRAKHLMRMDAGDGWVTISGTHVLLGEGGVAMGGGKLKGRAFTTAKSQKRTPKGGGGGSASGSGGSSGSTAEAQKPAAPHTLAKSDDISETWERRPDKFPNEIDDVIDAQGYNGKPRVVSKEEFDKAVEASGFVAQRVFSAPDEQTLADYDEQLKNGDFYVDCSTGGAQYGQGCYTAADYTGKITDGMKAEMDHYISQYNDLGKPKTEEQWLSDAKAKLQENGLLDENSEKWAEAYFEKNHDKSKPLMDVIDEDTRDKINETLRDVPTNQLQPHKIKTITLDPSAKIIKEKDITAMRADEVVKSKRKAADEVGEQRLKEAKLTPDEENYVRWGLRLTKDTDLNSAMNFAKTLSKDDKERLGKIHRSIEKEARSAGEAASNKIEDMDIGAYAALKGFSAINAEGHGESGSYTIILDRTRMIMLDD